MKKETFAQQIQAKLSATYSSIFNVFDLLNLIVSKDNFKNHSQLSSESLAGIKIIKSQFDIKRLTIVNKNADVIYSDFSSKDYNRMAQIFSGRDYFLKALDNPNQGHDGAIINSAMYYRELILPFSKAIMLNKKVVRVVIIAFPVEGFLRSLNHSTTYTITPSDYKPSQNIIGRISKVFFYQPHIKISTMSNSYEIDIDYNHVVFEKWIKFSIPWNIVFFMIIYIINYLDFLKTRLIRMVKSTFNHNEIQYISSSNVENELSFNEIFRILSETLLTTIETIREKDAYLKNIDTSISSTINEAKKLNIANESLNEELNDLINNKELNLNEEYISNLLEYKQNTHERVSFLENVLELLKLNLFEVKIGKENVVIAKIVENLSIHFKEHNAFPHDLKIKVFKKSFFMMLVFIKDYFKIMCHQSSLFIDKITETDKKISIVLKGKIKKHFNHLQDDEDSYLVLQKIRFLGQLNGFNVEIRDSENEEFLIIKQL